MKYQYFDEKNETLSRGELEALQQKRLVEMVRYTARNNEYFRKRYEAAGVDPKHSADWKIWANCRSCPRLISGNSIPTKCAVCRSPGLRKCTCPADPPERLW